MQRASASLFVGLTLFATGAIIGTGSLDGNEALAAPRGYSPSTSQGRTPTGGFRPTSLSQGKGKPYYNRFENKKVYPGTRRTQGDFRTDLQKANRGKGAGMGGPAPHPSYAGQKRYTGADPAPKGRANTKRMGSQ